jgi:hypothetical protein
MDFEKVARSFVLQELAAGFADLLRTSRFHLPPHGATSTACTLWINQPFCPSWQ